MYIILYVKYSSKPDGSTDEPKTHSQCLARFHAGGRKLKMADICCMQGGGGWNLVDSIMGQLMSCSLQLSAGLIMYCIKEIHSIAFVCLTSFRH